jgi:hypothetical protein
MWPYFQKHIWHLRRDPLFQITTFIEPIATGAEKAELPLQLAKNSPITMSTYPLCFGSSDRDLSIGSNEILLAPVYKPQDDAWSNAEITKLLTFKYKAILARDRNTKHPFWNSIFSNPLGENLLVLFHMKLFRNFSTTMSHSLFTWRKLWRAGYCGPSECQMSLFLISSTETIYQ